MTLGSACWDTALALDCGGGLPTFLATITLGVVGLEAPVGLEGVGAVPGEGVGAVPGEGVGAVLGEVVVEGVGALGDVVVVLGGHVSSTGS